MKLRAIFVATILTAIALTIWARSLYHVGRPGDRPQPLVAAPAEGRTAVTLDATLPAVPSGVGHLRSGERVALIHYWAPWERNARPQIQELDSLRREPSLERLQVTVVCLDPFPSVTRFVTRHRLRLAVLLDGKGELQRTLPCPSIPYTYVLDARGRIAVSQAGLVDWWNPTTLATLRELLEAGGDPPRRVERL